MLYLKIVTPERTILDDQVDSVTLPTQMGQITVLPHHIPLVANLAAGEISYLKDNQEQFFAVSGGVIEVTNNFVNILADTVEFGHEIDEKRAEEARERAKLLMTESYRDEKSFAGAAAGLEKQFVRLKVARKHRTRTHKNLESGTLSE